jgi:hypothetical protein
MPRIVRWCGVLLIGGLAVTLAQCSQSGRGSNVRPVQQPTRYMNCGNVPPGTPWSTANIGAAGGVIAAGPHLIIFPEKALPGDTEVRLRRIPSNGSQNRLGVHLMLNPDVQQFGADVSVLLNVNGCTDPGNPSWKIYRVPGNSPDGTGTPNEIQRAGDYFHTFTRVHSFLIVAD